eukprot:1203220-Rhodomonas_salina.3
MQDTGNSMVSTLSLDGFQHSRAVGDAESCMSDRALWIHGLPPTAGWGLGIDRLTMLLAGKTNIREVRVDGIAWFEHAHNQRVVAVGRKLASEGEEKSGVVRGDAHVA